MTVSMAKSNRLNQKGRLIVPKKIAGNDSICGDKLAFQNSPLLILKKKTIHIVDSLEIT